MSSQTEIIAKHVRKANRKMATWVKKKTPDPLEKAIEKKVVEHAQALGCLVYKFTSPSRRSVPDRLFIMPGGKGSFFIEFKRRGQKPTDAQALEIAKIQKQGAAVFVVDNIDAGRCLIADMLHGAKNVTTVLGVRVTMDDPLFN